MNISDVIKDIKLPNGLKTIALPYKQPIEVVVQDIIKTSVRTFSQFKPQKKECERYRKDLRYANEYERYRGIYFIPEELTTTGRPSSMTKPLLERPSAPESGETGSVPESSEHATTHAKPKHTMHQKEELLICIPK